MTGTARQVRRAVRWLGGSVFAAALLQYVLFFAAARYLGDVDYGAFSLALAVATLAAPFCDLGTSVAIVCTGARCPAELGRRFGAALLLRALTAVPVFAAALGLGLLAGYGPGFAALLPPLYLATLADGAGNLGASACQAEERVATSALLQVARHLLRGGALLGTLWWGGGPHALAWSFALASALGAAPAVLAVARRHRVQLRLGDLPATVREALPFGFAILATMLNAQIGVAVLGLYADTGEIGRYHASLRFVLLLQMVPQIVSVAAAPLSYRTGAEGLAPSARLYRVKLTLLAALGLCGSLLLAANGDWLVGTCLGPRFQGSEVLLVALAPVVFVKFVSSVLGDTLAAISRQDRLGLGCWIALLVNVGLGLVLMPSLGAMGAVVATLAAETVLLVFLAANVALAGVELAWTRVLVRPFGAALAALIAAFAVSPRFAVPAAVVVALLLAWRRPTAEERLLLPRLHGGTR